MSFPPANPWRSTTKLLEPSHRPNRVEDPTIRERGRVGAGGSFPPANPWRSTTKLLEPSHRPNRIEDPTIRERGRVGAGGKVDVEDRSALERGFLRLVASLRLVPIAAFSLAVVGALFAYALWGVPQPEATGPIIDVSVMGYLMVAVAIYYLGLFGLTLLNDGWTGIREPLLPRSGEFFMVLLVPAHNEELVIEDTLKSLTRLRYEHYRVIVLNDGSTDRTSELAHAFEKSGHVVVVDRSRDVAGQGKGAVLNHGFEIVKEAAERGEPWLAAWSPDRIVICVVDADGQLESNSLARVAPYFSDPRVGALQIPVHIANARDGLITRLQDLEFVGFSFYVQMARDLIGSVGLGGNGQFNRLSALLSLRRPPWTDCPTEDLDVGLSLAERGWRIRFRPGTFVAQQGLRNFFALLRQRTRWVQGNYQCFVHIPRLLVAHRAPFITRLDLCVYLLLVFFVMVVTCATGVLIAHLLGLVTAQNSVFAFLPDGPVRRVAYEIIGTGPIWVFLATYQRNSPNAVPWWQVPAYGALFAAYSYLGAVFTLRAWARMLTRRKRWVKTPRLASKAVE